jgi:hypothetical protein
LAFRIKYCRNGVTASFTDYHYNLVLAVLVPCAATITAMCFDVYGPQAAAKIAAVQLGLFAFPADDFISSTMASRNLRGLVNRNPPWALVSTSGLDKLRK